MVIFKFLLHKKIFKISEKDDILEILLNNKLLNTNIIKYNLNNFVLEMYSILFYMYYHIYKSSHMKFTAMCVYISQMHI